MSEKVEENSKPEQEIVEELPRVKMAGIMANIKPFSTEDDLEEYLNILEHIFICNETPDDKKVSCLIGMGGMDIAKSIFSISQPKKPSDYSYAELRKRLLEYYKPVRNVRAERFKFMSRMMKEEESLAEFIMELKLLASTCEYESFLDQALSDKLIWSIKDQAIQKQLVEEPISKKFEEICTKALSIEMVANGVRDIQSAGGSSNTNWVAKRKPKPSSRYEENSTDRPDLREKLSEMEKRVGMLQMSTEGSYGKAL